VGTKTRLGHLTGKKQKEKRGTISNIGIYLKAK
jgi:hypothetical protein